MAAIPASSTAARGSPRRSTGPRPTRATSTSSNVPSSTRAVPKPRTRPSISAGRTAGCARVLAGLAALLALAAVAGIVALNQRGEARDAARVADAQRLGVEGLGQERLDEALLLTSSSRGARRIPGHARQPALGAAAQFGGNRRAQLRLADVRRGLQPGREADRHGRRAWRRQRLRRRHSAPGRRALRDRGRPRPERALHAGRRVHRGQLHGSAEPRPQRHCGCDRRPDPEAHAPDQGASASRPAGLRVSGRGVPAERSGSPRPPCARLRAGRPGRAGVSGRREDRRASRIGSPWGSTHPTSTRRETADRQRFFLTSLRDSRTWQLDPEPLRVVRSWPVGDFAGAVSPGWDRAFALGTESGRVRLLDLRPATSGSFRAASRRTAWSGSRFTPDGRTLVTADELDSLYVGTSSAEPSPSGSAATPATSTGSTSRPTEGRFSQPRATPAPSSGTSPGDRRLDRRFAVEPRFNVPRHREESRSAPTGARWRSRTATGPSNWSTPGPWQPRASVRATEGFAASIDFSPDGRLLAVTGERRARHAVERADAWRPQGGSAGCGILSQALAFSPDGKLLAAAESLEDTRGTAPAARLGRPPAATHGLPSANRRQPRSRSARTAS